MAVNQAQYQAQAGVSALKHQAYTQNAVASAIISASEASLQVSGRAVSAPGQLLNGLA